MGSVERRGWEMFEVVAITAALTCGLVTGLLLGFAIVAMPGIRVLDDPAFLRGFQVMDRVIQDRQPVFMLLWVGSVVSVLAAAALGWGATAGLQRVLLLTAVALWLVGVQAPTATINIPLNDRVQALDLTTIDARAAADARAAFEPRWNRWNAIRSAVGAVATLLLLLVLLWR